MASEKPETEVIRIYKSLSKTDEYKPYVENIEKVKSLLTPKQNVELKNMLVSASEEKGVLKQHTLAFINKKIDRIRLDDSKEGREFRQRFLDNDVKYKVMGSRSIKELKLKRPKHHHTQRELTDIPSPIEEGDEESTPRSRSHGGKRRKTQKKYKKKRTWFGLF